MLDVVSVQIAGALLFSLVFLWLWRKSAARYFGFWGAVWAIQACAAFFVHVANATGQRRWLAGSLFLELVFALFVAGVARKGMADSTRVFFGSAWKVLLLFPVLYAVLDALGWDRGGFGVARAMPLSAIYFYSFRRINVGRRSLFHGLLSALALFYLLQAGVASFGLVGIGMTSLELALKTLLAFSAMALWIENPNDFGWERPAGNGFAWGSSETRIEQDPDMDYLTGLLPSSALRRRVDSDETFQGVAAVCDLDNFKAVNDRFGHMEGDEVLRNVGSLLRSSIRGEDLAYRWGGDEFAILFEDQERRLAHNRLMEIEARMDDFRIRGHGSLRVRFSWGVAEGNGGRLREVLERADREMYAQKRERARRAGAEPALEL